MTTKKAKTEVKPKMDNTPKLVYVAIEALSPEATSVSEVVLRRIVDGKYYSELSIAELVQTMQEDCIDDDYDVYKVTLTSMGKINRTKVMFTKVE